MLLLLQSHENGSKLVPSTEKCGDVYNPFILPYFSHFARQQRSSITTNNKAHFSIFSRSPFATRMLGEVEECQSSFFVSFSGGHSQAPSLITSNGISAETAAGLPRLRHPLPRLGPAYAGKGWNWALLPSLLRCLFQQPSLMFGSLFLLCSLSGTDSESVRWGVPEKASQHKTSILFRL